MKAEHIPEDLLDDYARNRTSAADRRCIEEHLLICERCRGMPAAIDDLIAVLRQAVAFLN